MKKTLNILIALTIVVLVCSCIPTPPVGGGGTPSNSVSISMTLPTQGANLQPYYSTNKTIYVDGDSLLISMSTTTTGMLSPKSTINILPLTNMQSYEYILRTDDVNYTGIISKYYSANITFSDTSSYNWIGIPISGIGIEGATVFFGTGMYGSYNQDKFIVFRKLTNDGYLYFWLKFKENYALAPGGNILVGNNLTIYNIKYQMHSIITGQ